MRNKAMPNESFANYKPAGMQVRLQIKYFPESDSFAEYQQGLGDKRAMSQRKLTTTPAYIQIAMGNEATCFYQPKEIAAELLEAQLTRVRGSTQEHATA